MKIGSVPPSGKGGSRPPQESLEAALMLSEEDRQAATRELAGALQQHSGNLSREELLSGLELARGAWEAEPPGRARRRALKGCREDEGRLLGPDLPSIAGALLSGLETRQQRCKNFSRLGLGLALGGFLGAMTGHPVAAPIGLGVGLLSAAGAAWFGLSRHRTPEQDTLVRLTTYAQVAKEQRQERKRFEELAEETRQMVSALGEERSPQIRPTQDGVMVGTVFLPRKRPH